MTVPAPHPNDFRYLPKKVYRKYLKDHDVMVNFITQGMNRYQNDAALAPIVEKIKQNSEHLSASIFILSILFGLLEYSQDRQRFVKVIQTLIKLINGDTSEKVDPEEITGLFDHISTITFVDGNSFFVTNKDFYNFKIALAAQVEKSFSDEENGKIYDVIVQKELFKASTVNKIVSVKKANYIDTKDKALKDVVKDKIDDLKHKYGISEPKIIEFYVDEFEKLTKKHNETGLDKNVKLDYFAGLTLLKEIVSDEGFSDSDKLSEITKIEARFPEIYLGNSSLKVEQLVKDIKEYFNPNFEKVTSDKLPLEYHVTIAHENDIIKTLHTLNSKISKIIKDKMHKIHQQIVDILKKEFKATTPIQQKIHMMINQIKAGHHTTDIFDVFKKNLSVDFNQKTNIETLLHELQALGYLLSDLKFSLHDDINAQSLFQQCGKTLLQNTSPFSWFFPSFFRRSGFLTVHNIFEMVAKEVSAQREAFMDTYRIDKKSSINEIQQKIEDHVPNAPKQKNTTCGFIFC